MTRSTPHPFSQLAFATASGGDDKVYFVEQWRCAIHLRPIGDSGYWDAAGCYPFSPIDSGADLKRGLKALAEKDLVSAVLVTDPLNMPPLEKLQDAFDFVRPFKTHFIYDKAIGPISYSRRNWREVRSARTALHFAEIEYAEHHTDMARLYGNLVGEKSIRGSANFGADFFHALADLDCIRAVAAWREDRLVSMMLFVQYGHTAYSFLAGTSAEGRQFAAHYGLYAEAIENFSGISVFNLGGVPGTGDDLTHGIAHAKGKLTNARRQSYLCGSTFDKLAYDRLCLSKDAALEAAFFPRYRA